MNYKKVEEQIIKITDEELNNYLSSKSFLLKERAFKGTCRKPLKYIKCANYVNSYCWRCVSLNFSDYKKRISIREGSFFEHFGKNIRKVSKVLCNGVLRHTEFYFGWCLD